MRLRTVGHGVPGVSARPGGIDILGRGIPIGLRGHDRPPCLHVDVSSPVHVGIVLRGEELAGLSVEDVEEAVLGGLHDHRPGRAVYGQVGKNQFLYRVVVPAVARRGLVIPGHASGGRVQRQDGCGEQAVELRRPELAQVIGRRVGRAEVHEIQGWIVGKSVPRRSAPMQLGFAMGIPSLVRLRQFRILIGLPDGGRYRVEAPFERAGFQIVGRHIAAHGSVAHVGAAIADDHDSACNLRRARAGVGQLVIGDGIGFPDLLARPGVQRMQTSVGRGNINLALPHRHAAVDQITAGVSADEVVGLRVIAPQFLAAGGIHRVHITPGSRGVHDSVDDDGGGFLTAHGIAQVVLPRKPQLLDVLRVDVRQG